MELLEELSDPTSFNHTIVHDTILSLNARSGGDVLALGGLGDEVVTEEHSIAHDVPTCIRATHPVRIRVDR
jgi:hypothetical protein